MGERSKRDAENLRYDLSEKPVITSAQLAAVEHCHGTAAAGALLGFMSSSIEENLGNRDLLRRLLEALSDSDAKQLLCCYGIEEAADTELQRESGNLRVWKHRKIEKIQEYIERNGWTAESLGWRSAA